MSAPELIRLETVQSLLMASLLGFLSPQLELLVSLTTFSQFFKKIRSRLHGAQFPAVVI